MSFTHSLRIHPFAANVTRLRQARGWAQHELATFAGMSLSLVSQIERSRITNPRLETLKALAKVFDITIDELVREG